ncbi:hypothetical protein [Algoriphagus sp.]|uniref:hypothetical protein n=1 Tax=Algoriphagus sp. TaxID=1872435 RepID=UPI00391DB190
MKISKTIHQLLTVFILSLFLVTTNSMAQDEQRSRSQTVYLEVLGNGLIYSLNYDTRFSNSVKGLGGRAGIGHMAINGDRLTTFPFLVNYLFGRDKHYFEVGAGATLLTASAFSNFGPVDSRESGSAFIGTMSLGYRLEPLNGGFSFRAGITPIFDRKSFFPFWPQISFGYAF